MKTVSPIQVRNIDEKRFTLGRELTGARNHRIITAAANSADITRTKFGMNVECHV